MNQVRRFERTCFQYSRACVFDMKDNLVQVAQLTHLFDSIKASDMLVNLLVYFTIRSNMLFHSFLLLKRMANI